MTAYDACTLFLFSKGFGNDLRTVSQYRCSVEPIPEGLIEPDSDLQYISLADPRTELLHACRLLGINKDWEMDEECDTVPFDNRFPLPTEPFWFRHDDGRKNRKRRPDHCRDKLVGKIQAGSATEGVFAFAHNPRILAGGRHIIDLPRTVRRTARLNCGYLQMVDGEAVLSFYRGSDIASPLYGTLRLRRE